MIGTEFLSGVAAATFAASSIFFLKFWAASNDKFFLHFAIATLFLALERLILLVVLETYETPRPEQVAWVYLVRLASFAIILHGIIKKNQNSSIKR